MAAAPRRQQPGTRTAGNCMLTNPTHNELGRRRTNNSDMEADFEDHFEIPLHSVYIQGFFGWDRDGKAFSSLLARESKKEKPGREGEDARGFTYSAREGVTRRLYLVG